MLVIPQNYDSYTWDIVRKENEKAFEWHNIQFKWCGDNWAMATQNS